MCRQGWRTPPKTNMSAIFKVLMEPFFQLQFFIGYFTLPLRTKIHTNHFNNTYFTTFYLCLLSEKGQEKKPEKPISNRKLPIGLFSYSSSFLHSISIPSIGQRSGLPFCAAIPISNSFPFKNPLDIVRCFSI